MLDGPDPQAFAPLNRAYNQTFVNNRLTIGLVVPLETYATSPVPTMERSVERAKLADDLGFSALWLRDVPFNVPNFGDAGQVFDPFVYLGLLSGATRNIGLGVASIVLPLRHPAHVAKAAASADVLSDGRVLLGIASGDRPDEFPALNMSYADRGARFRDAVEYIQAVGESYPKFDGAHGRLSGGIDMLPKPVARRLPMLITGGSQQSPEWIATHADGWMTYPRDTLHQGQVVQAYRQRIAEAGGQNKPVMQSLYVDVIEDDEAPPHPIHLGFRSGVSFLKHYLSELQDLGINHVALNLRFNSADMEDTMKHLAASLLTDFPTRGNHHG